ncbi:PD40 domain-containing protein [Cyanobacteria bacterium FACHB-63]|nr:PD40 domain-containing protein [Cyanobacteria bacterium FACHB-63]
MPIPGSCSAPIDFSIAFSRVLKFTLPLALRPTREYLATGRKGMFELWDVRSKTAIRQFGDYSGWTDAIAFSPDGQTIASSAPDNKIRLWNAQTGAEIRALRVLASVKVLVFSPTGAILASGDDDGNLHLWDLEMFEEVYRSKMYSKKLTAIAFSADGKMIATAGGSCQIHVCKFTE